MVLYTCNLCVFKTTHTTNYEKHCLTKKHFRRLEKFDIETNMVIRTEHNPCDSKMTPIDSQMTPIDSQMTSIDSLEILKLENEHICEYCNKKMSKNSNLHRHLKTCKIKKNYHKIETLKDLEIKRLKFENDKLKNNSSTTNTINISYIKNDKVLNYLNSNFQEAIEMDSFINKLKNDTSLSREIMDCFVTCYNNGGPDSFGVTLVKYLNQICKQLNIDIFPLCCSDSNLRSHKEKNSVGWETVIDTTKIEDIINHLVTDIFLETNTMIILDAKERKKICNIVKKGYGLSSIEMIENVYKNNNEINIPL